MPLDKFLAVAKRCICSNTTPFGLPVDPDENNIAAGVFSLKTGKFIKLLFNSLLSTNIFLFSQFISILFCITFK